MKTINTRNNRQPDQVLVDIAEYVLNEACVSNNALTIARYCLMDTIGCGILALRYPECTKLLGPIVPGASLFRGARVPGTSYELDPVQAAFNIGTMNRWLDFNDAWAGAEWGHPSDNLGGILAIADYLSRLAISEGKVPLKIKDLLLAMIKAYEIQGVIALKNSFNRLGFDHVLLVRVATAAVVTKMLGGKIQEVINAVSNAWLDGLTLRTYRSDTGSRKGWAAGDATSRGVRLALMSMQGEMGYPSALTEPQWGFQDVLFKGNSLKIEQKYGTYVMENILFKIPFPAEGHALTACEAAVKLHSYVKDRLHEIDKIIIQTQESAMRIINKSGTLNNPADRDHCLQYMVAVCLIKGDLRYEDYEDDAASDPRIDALREKMVVIENQQFSNDYMEPNKRSVTNEVQVFFNRGTQTNPIKVEYPVGHPSRRQEGIPLVQAKFERNIATRLSPKNCAKLLELFADPNGLENTTVNDFITLLALGS